MKPVTAKFIVRTPDLHERFCKHCKGLNSSPNWRRHIVRSVRRHHTRLARCHKAIAVSRLSWDAAVYYGIISAVPVAELEHIGLNRFAQIGSTPLPPALFESLLVPNPSRWSWV